MQEKPRPDSRAGQRKRKALRASRNETTTRANFLPEPRFVPLRPALQEHLAKVGAAITPENFLSICDEMLLKVLKETFARIAADEGSIWLLDQEKKNLVASLQQRTELRQDHRVQATR